MSPRPTRWRTRGDDFADACACAVHVVPQQRPWQITICRRGETVKVF